MGKLIDRLKATHLKQAKAILKHKSTILDKTMVVLDPSSKSLGLAVTRQGTIVDNRAVRAPDREPIGVRLGEIYARLPTIEYVDILVTEKVRSSTGHIYLVWSNGVVIAKYRPQIVLEVSAGAWQKTIDDDYIKGDMMDAKYIANFVLKLCKEDE